MASTLVGVMPKKKAPSSEFGMRLMELRQQRGLTQVELAKAAGSTQRAVSYYETVAEWPTVPQLIAIAHALRVTADELLGLKPPSKLAIQKLKPEDVALMKRLRIVSQLPERDRRAVLRLIDSVAIAKEARKS
jgi:transcriptional regulator with XRE-family HTH domain